MMRITWLNVSFDHVNSIISMTFLSASPLHARTPPPLLTVLAVGPVQSVGFAMNIFSTAAHAQAQIDRMNQIHQINQDFRMNYEAALAVQNNFMANGLLGSMPVTRWMICSHFSM